jgi:large conductance mechanosensitive channel
MLNDFRTFVTRGNVIDLAVGIVIGAAFSTVVTSFVDDILMPPVGRIMGNTDFSDLFINLSGGEYPSLAKAKEAGAATINYGVFLNNVIAFLIVAAAVFLLVRNYDRLRSPADAKPDAIDDKECPFCRLRIPREASRCGYCTSSLSF